MKQETTIEGEAYVAARDGALRLDRSHRVRLRMEGRAPAQMLTGIVTGRIPEAPRPVGTGESGGASPGGEAGGSATASLQVSHVHPSAVLTPKGKVVAELRLHRLEGGDGGAFLLDLPHEAREGLLEHFGRYLPPRFARAVDVSGETAHLTVMGPEAAGHLASALEEVLSAAGPGVSELGAMEEGEAWVVPDPGALPGEPLGGALRLVRSGDVDPLAFDLLGSRSLLERMDRALAEREVPKGDGGLWEIFRVERGQPVFGRELDPEVIPTEAGLQHRWVDHQKGCYTGQEVIVRIRDRGRVNRHLRGVLLGEGAAASPGVPLYAPGRDRPAGELRSVVRSPRFGQVVALAYVRREVEPPAGVAVGSHDGPPAQVRALADHGWELVPGDPGT